MIRPLDDRVMISGQIAPHEVAGLAQQGIIMLVNNRPDSEDVDQPTSDEIEAAADTAGILYRHVPISRLGPADVEAMQEAMRDAGDGKLLAYCRSGTRSAYACALAHREVGVSAVEIERRLTGAGVDPGPISHLL